VKLDIDRPQDFKFHVAYGVYSRAWEDNGSETARNKLNELISALSKDDSETAITHSILGYRSTEEMAWDSDPEG